MEYNCFKYKTAISEMAEIMYVLLSSYLSSKLSSRLGLPKHIFVIYLKPEKQSNPKCDEPCNVCRLAFQISIFYI